MWLACTGGADLDIFRVRVTSHDPGRPAIAALVAFAIFVAAKGRWSTIRGWIEAADRVNERFLAGALALGLTIVGITYATTVAGGSDSYGYVSEADLWLKGQLKTPQPWMYDAPWPFPSGSFAPLGYLPGNTLRNSLSIVPVYSPGLPLLMAGAKLVGGQEGMFWVVPILGGVLALATFGIGRRLGAPRAGLIGALLVATSPTVLVMLMAPMTDVAVAGAWAAAFYFLLGESRASAFAAGLTSAVAILIRPNISFEAAVLGVWYLMRAWRSGAWRHELARAGLFALGAALGCTAVAIFNNFLYGSPLISGYGAIAEEFTRANIPVNAKLYAHWFIDAHTPAALIGFLPLVLPLKWFWPSAKDRSIFLVIGAFVTLIFLEFFAFLVFDVWWYLRFILPCLPFIMIGVGAVATAVARAGKLVVAGVVAALVMVLGVRNVRAATEQGVFDLWRGDRRYVVAAQMMRQMTERTSIVYAMQHSGSLRYYGGRLTVRWDLIDDRWLDRSVSWFQSRGVHPYVLLEEWEIEPFKKRFAGANSLALLDGQPMFTYEGGARVFLFDLVGPSATSTVNVVDSYTEPLRSIRPATTETLTLGG